MPTLADLKNLIAPSILPKSGKPKKRLQFAVLGEYPNETALVADIIQQWNIIEHSFYGILAALLRTNYGHARVLFGSVISSRARLDLLLAVGTHELRNSPTTLKEFQAVIKGLGSCLKTRNRYAHGIYVVNAKAKLCILHSEFDIPPSAKHMTVIHEKVLWKEHKTADKFRKQLHGLREKLIAALSPKTRQALSQIWIQQDLLP
jgi:hypothetical protein